MAQETAKQIFGIIVRVVGLYLLVNACTSLLHWLPGSLERLVSSFLDGVLTVVIGLLLFLKADWVVDKSYPAKGLGDVR
jgi:hypothetical protein